MLISIITPTFNRSELLKNCFKSLTEQSVTNFEWIIVDDGSSDQTENVVNDFLNMETTFPILYYKKNNGGKHTALNFAMDKINGDVCCILDSDDIFLPEAIAEINNEWLSYFKDQTIGVVCFLRGFDPENAISHISEGTKIVSNHIDYRINQGIKGDFCETIRVNTFKKFRFPVFPEEKFFSEGWLWTNIGIGYKTVYVNKIIYLTEYRDDGLTRAGRALRLKSPKAGMLNSYVQMNKKIKMKYRLKQGILYNVYKSRVRESDRKKIIKQNDYRLIRGITKPISWVLSYYWNKKFL
ncbi:glycosyltransferase family 2 protein [Enterococcus viikkiensis]|uniref:glycosyltransferase family 2 protein n=1 Tax=Enterococcus viikkiensis TaxID=930854 RepID=UPI0010F846E0|nr:glycosyltransferase family 2 protein [Enterococcus viikkiensis]